MKKTILITSLALFSIQQTHAQISISPEVGMNLSKYSTSSDDPMFTASGKSGTQIGLRAGAYVTFPIGASGVFIQPGLFYSMRGGQDSYSDQGTKYKQAIKVNYLEIPVNVGYQYNFGKAGAIFATAGPYLGMGLSAKIVESVSGTGPSESQSVKVSFGSGGDEFKRMDAGMNLGIGYKSVVGAYVRAQYSLGFSNLLNDDYMSFKNRGFAFTLGYEFKAAPKKKAAAKKL